MREDIIRKVHFSPLEKAVSNPYIGFTSYQRFRGNPLFSDIVVRPDGGMLETERTECYPVSAEAALKKESESGFYPDTEVAYIRILWKDFEPQRKKYNYALIADILKKAKERGQTVMFRLIPHSTRASDDVPEWLKRMIPCPERPEGKRVKDSPLDPLWLRLFGEAIEALGNAFDSDPTLDVVDLSITGAWGEGHRVADYPEEALQTLADTYARAFPNTRLIGQVAAPWLNNYLNAIHPCAWRGDGTGDPKHMEVIYPAAAEMMPDLWKKAPVSFESYWWLGEWERHGWDIDEIIESTLSWHVSTFNGKSFPIPEKWREKIEYWRSKMGYHFLLSEASYPVKAKAGERVPFTLKIANRGVAPIYNDIPLRVRLRGTNDYFFTTDVDVREWLPGEHEVKFDLALPADLPVGEYDAAITLSGEGTPLVKWETQGEEEGFLTIGPIAVTRDEPARGKTLLKKRKDYLIDFLREFEYVAEARTALKSAFDFLFADAESAHLYEEIRAYFEKSPDEKFKYLVEASKKIAARCAINEYTVYLLVLILLSETSKKVYAERNVSAEMWRSTMRDLKYFCDHCFLIKGVYGTFCPEWADRFFAATRFTFGRLQFETDRLGKPYQKDGVALTPDDRVIFIHIPRTGTPLLPEEVDASVSAASEFFRKRYGISDVIFACHSWLLYPENKQMLSEKSNLYSFMSRFEIIDVQEDPTHKELWRLFDKDYNGDADALPQDTSLRRAYVQRLKEKKPLGIGLGVWIYYRSEK